MSVFDFKGIKKAAQGKWREIILSLCPSISESHLTGKHGPCPNPSCDSKTDGWRVFDDFDQTGGAICSGCFTQGNGTGIKVIEWANGYDYITAHRAVNDHLGLTLAPEKLPKSKRKQGEGLLGQVRQLDGSELLKFAEDWASTQEGINAEEVIAAGGIPCTWPKSDQHSKKCLAFLAYLGTGKVTAINLLRVDGQEFTPQDTTPHKIHLVKGSEVSWHYPSGWERTFAATIIWRVEGLKDALALQPYLPDGHAVVTSSHGCNFSRKIILSPFKDKIVYSVGDADTPGRQGAIDLATAAATTATEARVIELPGDIKPNHGKDLRDYFNEGGTFDKLMEIAEAAAPVEAGDVSEKLAPTESKHLTVKNFREAPGKGDDPPDKVPLNLKAVDDSLQAAKGDWPRVADGRLFVHHDGHSEVRWLKNTQQFTSWMNDGLLRPIHFQRGAGYISEASLFENCLEHKARYRAVEYSPHEPLVSDLYYACQQPEPGNGAHLNWLLNRFVPESDIDRSLIVALLATVIWGGEPGLRPAFVITGNGRGCGKSTLAAIASELVGGFCDISSGEDAEKIKTRLLSPEGRRMRIALIDNLKSRKFSWAELESLVTAPVISGKEMYTGEGQRPNLLTWCITVNGVAFSRDMAQRIVTINLTQPKRERGTWREETLSYVREHRREIVGDLVSLLRADRSPLEKYSRWESWEHDVLCRLPNPKEIQETILTRQGEADVDEEESGILEEHFERKLVDLRYDTKIDRVFIPGHIASEWYFELTGERGSQTKATRAIKEQIGQGIIKNLLVSNRREEGRGLYWLPASKVGIAKADTRTDIESRIDAYSSRKVS